ncbi:MAG: MarR family transcriptional regulator [Eubacterium sp.]|nr:MarR family transcriptional regulator [Eubacterium sp.]
MFDAHDCIAMLTNRGAKALDEEMNRRFSSEEITRVQWTALYFISIAGEMTQKELARALMISEPSASNLVSRMLSSDLLVRSADTRKSHAKSIKLSAKGKAVLDEIYPVVEDFNKVATSEISEEDLNTFKRVMAKMIESVSGDRD